MNNNCTPLEVYDKKTGTCIPAPRLKNACKKGIRDPITGYCPGYPKGAAAAAPAPNNNSALANLTERVNRIEQQLVTLVGRRPTSLRSSSIRKSATVVRSSRKSPSVAVIVRDKTRRRRRAPLRVSSAKKKSSMSTMSSSPAAIIRNKTRRLVPLSYKSFNAPRDPAAPLPSIPPSVSSSSSSTTSRNPFYMSTAEADAEQERINKMTQSEKEAFLAAS